MSFSAVLAPADQTYSSGWGNPVLDPILAKRNSGKENRYSVKPAPNIPLSVKGVPVDLNPQWDYSPGDDPGLAKLAAYESTDFSPENAAKAYNNATMDNSSAFQAGVDGIYSVGAAVYNDVKAGASKVIDTGSSILSSGLDLAKLIALLGIAAVTAYIYTQYKKAA